MSIGVQNWGSLGTDECGNGQIPSTGVHVVVDAPRRYRRVGTAPVEREESRCRIPTPPDGLHKPGVDQKMTRIEDAGVDVVRWDMVGTR